MGVHVAKSAAKAQAIVFALLGLALLVPILLGPVRGGAGARAELVVILPGLTWLLASYFAFARLEWNTETLSTIRFGFIRRTVDLRQLARVETKKRLGGYYYVVTDHGDHSVELPPLLFARREEWARVLVDAIHVSGAATDTDAHHFLASTASRHIR